MFGFLSTKAKNVQVGVDFMPTGVAVIDVLTDKNRYGQVRHSDFLPAVGMADQTRVLHEWVDQHDLRDAACNSLIAKHDVQQLQLEKPAVDDDELLQAVSWKIKDLINFDAQNAVVDVFQLPPSPKNPASYINAVVANESVVQTYVDSIKQCNLDLKVIDVHDLVGKNLQDVKDAQQTMALLQFTDNDGLMTIYHEQDLYVARDFKIGLLDIESTLQDDDESLYENLLLELQRSMDYFESMYGMGPIRKMLIFPQTAGTEKMAMYLQNYVGYELDFTQIKMQDPEKQMNKHCFAAYCAALREAS